MPELSEMVQRDWRYVEAFVLRSPGEWFRIMPVGKFEKFGRFIEINDDMLQDMIDNYRIVPPTRLPVNREHMSEHGKVGDIEGLQRRPDGLYATINWTDEGLRLLRENAFQYFSPEVIFGPADYEGRMVRNILYGLALTNHPFFGEHTALFSLDAMVTAGDSPDFRDTAQGVNQMDENKVVEGLWVKFRETLGLNGAAPTPAPGPSVEEFAALKAERDKLAQEKEAAEKAAKEAAEKALFAARVGRFTEVLPEALGALAEKFAAIEDETLALELAQDFKALAAQQSSAALFEEVGTADGDVNTADPAARFEALVDTKVKAGMDEADAMDEAGREQPDHARAYLERARIPARQNGRN